MTITVSTDGSALGNPNGPMGWAWADHEPAAGGKPGHEHAGDCDAGGATNGTTGGDTGAADWTTPSGGYFFSFNTPAGCASEIVRRCEACGVKFTPAGATYPRGVDPEDRNIRIAPSFATVSEIETATRILALCTKMVGIEKRMRALAN